MYDAEEVKECVLWRERGPWCLMGSIIIDILEGCGWGITEKRKEGCIQGEEGYGYQRGSVTILGSSKP